MANPEIQNLTVRELEEAREFRLTREEYVGLRRRLLDRFRDAMSKEVTPQIEANLRKSQTFRESLISAERESLRKQMRPEVEKELHKDLLAKVEAEVGAKKRDEALAKLRGEKPNAECIATFSAYLRDIETEAQSLAETASDYSDAMDARVKVNRWTRRPMAVAGWIGMIPAAIWLITSGYGLESLALWGVLATILASSIWTTYKYTDVRDAVCESSARNRKISSDYLLIVDEARRIRMSVLPNAESVAEIRGAVQVLTAQKRELDAKFAPATKDLNENRKKVRVRVLDDINPMDVLEAVESERYQPGSQVGASHSR